MNRNKVFKWLYGVFMFLPMLAIGVTCAYVTFNKNAKDSYSGINGYELDYKYETNEVNSYTDIKTNNIYTFDLDYVDTPILQVGSISFVQQKRDNQQTDNYIIQDSVACYLYTNSGRLEWYINLKNQGGTIRLDATYPTQLVFTNFTNVFQELIPVSSVSATSIDDNVLVGVTIDNQGTLDNAFYYAVDTFNESGFNQVDFVSFFDFLYVSPNIWTTFANCYINYSMFVTLCFFLPSVLLWFVNFSYKLVDGFSNKVMR